MAIVSKSEYAAKLADLEQEAVLQLDGLQRRWWKNWLARLMLAESIRQEIITLKRMQEALR